MNDLSAKKSLGQNFLKSKKAIHQMISAVETVETDTIVEIGPGKGALTRPILEAGARVIAFELDSRMIDFLNEELAEYVNSGKLILVHQDVLDIDLEKFWKDYGDYKVIANIPYYITNAIIRKFLDTEKQPLQMSLLMQKEVAERIVKRDGKASLLSLSIKVFGDARYVGKVEKKYFSPSPKVDSAIIHIDNIAHDKIERELEEKFFQYIRAGFAHKRKQLFKNLSTFIPKEVLDEKFTRAGLDKKVRAEDLSLSDWKKILT